jgi:hypothetical protein
MKSIGDRNNSMAHINRGWIPRLIHGQELEIQSRDVTKSKGLNCARDNLKRAANATQIDVQARCFSYIGRLAIQQ